MSTRTESLRAAEPLRAPTRIQRRSRGGAALAALLLGVLPAEPAHGDGSMPYRVGFFPYMFSEVRENDAQVAVKTWVNVIAAESGLRVEPRAAVYEEVAAAIAAARAGHLDILLLSTIDYLRIAEELPPGILVYPRRAAAGAEEYLLLVRTDSGITELAQLAGADLLALRQASMMLAEPWLDHELQRHGLPAARRHFASVDRMGRPAKVVLPVFFGQATACLVNRTAFDTLGELNPQLRQRLRVLAISPRYVPTVVWLSTPPGSAAHRRAANAIRRLHAHPAGRQTLLLFEYAQMEDCDPSELESARALLPLTPLAVADSAPARRAPE